MHYRANFFFFELKSTYEMRISDCSSDVCSSDLLSVPIIKDVLAIRVAGNYNHRRGYTKVIGTSQRLDERNNDSQRLSVLVQPTAWLKNTTIYDRFHADQASSAYVAVGYNPALPLFHLDQTFGEFIFNNPDRKSTR